MDEAARCHRVALVHEGRILAEGAPDALVRGLECTTAEVIGGDRARVHELLESRPEVLAASPAGAQLRIVIAPRAEGAVAEALAAVGAEMRPTHPGFEDLFLARVALAPKQKAA
jgi:ABC-2 type transport system ATP-binding protein